MHKYIRTYVRPPFAQFSVVTFHFSQSLDPLLCVPHRILPPPAVLAHFSILSLSLSLFPSLPPFFSSSFRPQMKMFGQISGRAQSGPPTQIFSVSAESRAITTGAHKSWRSGWSGSTAGSELAAVNRYRVAQDASYEDINFGRARTYVRTYVRYDLASTVTICSRDADRRRSRRSRREWRRGFNR